MLTDITLRTGRIWRRITSAAASATTPSAAAVAYFGSTGHRLLPLKTGSSLVVDASVASVSAGLTDPRSLRRLHENGVAVHSMPLLHAKAFAFDAIAFVGSTNVSNNSANTLIEAALATTCSQAIGEVRDLVSSLCTDLLDDDALDWLTARYRPPRSRIPSIAGRPFSRLVMQIVSSDQQGYSGHQVQPQSGAWSSFFGINIDDEDFPVLRLRNIRTGEVIDRKVVRHALVMTIDIPEAEPGSILEMWKVGSDRYDYRVVLPGERGFATLDQALQTTPNPLRRSGRLWFTT